MRWLGAVVFMASSGCSGANVDALRTARVASDYAADVITIASKGVEAAATADAQVRMVSCAQELWADRYLCKKNAIDAAILAARPAEARVKALVEVQHALVDALTAAGTCEASDNAKSCRTARANDVARAAAGVAAAVKSLAETK